MQRKVIVLAGANNLAIEEMFKARGWEITNDIYEADLVQFTGGADVSPLYYGEHEHPTTASSPSRDEAEIAIYKTALALGTAMAGICRGGQFLNVMNGGKLWQDVDNHAIHGTHDAYIVGGIIPVQVSSTHHQMMRPNHSPQAECHMLMTAKVSTHKENMSDLNTAPYAISSFRISDAHLDDMEALYYASTNCLCYQPHPEFAGSIYKDCRDLYFHWIDQYLFGIDPVDGVPF